MFKCSECNAVYNNKPDYCDCGNDTFETMYVQSAQTPSQTQNYYEEPLVSSIPKKPVNIKQVLSNAIFIVCIILAICSWIFIGKDSSKIKNVDGSVVINEETMAASAIPNIDVVWDSTTPAAQKQIGIKAPSAPKNSAILNTRMSTLDSEMRTYVVSLGQLFVSSWARGSVVGDGACEVEFRIDNNGRVTNKKIIKVSNNTTMDESIKLMLENVTQTKNPPPGYQGERIIMAFSIQNRTFKVYYPQY